MGKSARRTDSSRDPGAFIALPWSVVDSQAYLSLSHPARSLLLEAARQLTGRGNNGTLVLSRAKLRSRGWKSGDTLHRATHELLNAGFLYQTVMGHRPNKASWFAVTWMTLDRSALYDSGTSASFRRGSYRDPPALKIAGLSPRGGTMAPSVAPPGGVASDRSGPSGGAIRAFSLSLPTPSDGHHLEVPSVGHERQREARSLGARTAGGSTSAGA